MRWQSAVTRGVNTALREMKREYKRQQREIARQQKLYQKQVELQAANAKVDRHNEKLEELCLLHCAECEPVDWARIASSEAPMAPFRTNHAERAARNALEAFQPTFIDMVLCRVAKKRAALKERIVAAHQSDEREYEVAWTDYQNAYAQWVADQNLASRILKHDQTAFDEALRRFGQFSSRHVSGPRVTVKIHADSTVEAVIHGLTDQQVPANGMKVLKSGKISVKPLPKTKFCALYQGYVCSTVLLTAKVALALLPTENVVVTAKEATDTSSEAVIEQMPILTVAVAKNSLGNLIAQVVDPVAIVETLPHRMKFLKTKGFCPLDEKNCEELIRAFQW